MRMLVCITLKLPYNSFCRQRTVLAENCAGLAYSSNQCIYIYVYLIRGSTKWVDVGDILTEYIRGRHIMCF